MDTTLISKNLGLTRVLQDPFPWCPQGFPVHVPSKTIQPSPLSVCQMLSRPAGRASCTAAPQGLARRDPPLAHVQYVFQRPPPVAWCITSMMTCTIRIHVDRRRVARIRAPLVHKSDLCKVAFCVFFSINHTGAPRTPLFVNDVFFFSYILYLSATHSIIPLRLPGMPGE